MWGTLRMSGPGSSGSQFLTYARAYLPSRVLPYNIQQLFQIEWLPKAPMDFNLRHWPGGIMCSGHKNNW